MCTMQHRCDYFTTMWHRVWLTQWQLNRAEPNEITQHVGNSVLELISVSRSGKSIEIVHSTIKMPCRAYSSIYEWNYSYGALEIRIRASWESQTYFNPDQSHDKSISLCSSQFCDLFISLTKEEEIWLFVLMKSRISHPRLRRWTEKCTFCFQSKSNDTK
jgi:hypothetical protein